MNNELTGFLEKDIEILVELMMTNTTITELKKGDVVIKTKKDDENEYHEIGDKGVVIAGLNIESESYYIVGFFSDIIGFCNPLIKKDANEYTTFMTFISGTKIEKAN